ncbi:MAG: FMN-binding protein [Propionibacteriaceae bacterium]
MTRRTWHGVVLYLIILAAGVIAFILRTQPDWSTVTPPTSVTRSATAPAPTSSSRPRISSATPKSPATTASPSTTSVTGDPAQTPYGPVQVTVIFTGSSITDVKAIATPDGDRRSISIAEYAVPTLHDEVIASQSAQIDTVSGATYTSDGYAQSLQSAIDKHG